MGDMHVEATETRASTPTDNPIPMPESGSKTVFQRKPVAGASKDNLE